MLGGWDFGCLKKFGCRDVLMLGCLDVGMRSYHARPAMGRRISIFISIVNTVINKCTLMTY